MSFQCPEYFIKCCDKGNNKHKVVWGPKEELLIQDGAGSGGEDVRKMTLKNSDIPGRENPLGRCMMV